MRKSWRNPKINIPDFSKNKFEIFPPTQFFDGLSFIGDEFVGCFLLETDKGLALLDCMEQENHYIDMIEQGFKDLGKDIHNLKTILISHGHGDHFGRADYFQKKYGSKIYMSKIDYEFAKNMPIELNWDSACFQVDHFLKDEEIIDFGDIKIKAVATPGHTEGCFSFIIPVSDEGRPHTAALWGWSRNCKRF